MSWAEVQVLKDRQEPMYINGKKVTRINICTDPHLQEYKSQYASGTGFTVSFDKDGIYLYRCGISGSDLYYYKYNIDEDVVTLVDGSYGNNLVQPSSSFYRGYMFNSSGTIRRFISTRTNALKLKDYYVFLPLYDEDTLSASTKATIGVTSTSNYIITKQSDTIATNKTVYTELGLSSGSVNDYLCVNIYRTDYDNNRFWFFLIKDYVSSTKKSTILFYRADVNNNMTVTLKYIGSTEGERKQRGSSTEYDDVTNLWNIEYKKLLFGDRIYTEDENGDLTVRQLTDDEKEVFSFKPEGGAFYYMLRLKDNILYKFGSYSGNEQVYKNTYYINGDKTWTLSTYKFDSNNDKGIKWDHVITNYCNYSLYGIGTGKDIKSIDGHYCRSDGSFIEFTKSSIGNNMVDCYVGDNNKIYDADEIQYVFETN